MQRLKHPEPLLPDIPSSAPTKKQSPFDIGYQKKKRQLASRLPVLKPEDLVGRPAKPLPSLCLNSTSASMGYPNLTEYVDRWFRRDQTISSNKLQEAELELNFLHDTGHWLLEEGHLWEAEECYALAFEDFRFPSEGEQFEDLLADNPKEAGDPKETKKSAGPDNDEIEQMRLDLAWAMYGVAAGQNLWSRMAGLLRSERKEDIRSVQRFKSSHKQMKAVRRPNYSTEAVADINKPWEFTGLDINRECISVPESEASWQTEFVAAVSKQQKGAFKMGLCSSLLEATSIESSFSIPDTNDSKTGIRRVRARSVRTDTEMDRFVEIMKEVDNEGEMETRKSLVKFQEEKMRRMSQTMSEFASKINIIRGTGSETEEEEDEDDEALNYSKHSYKEFFNNLGN